MLKRSRNRVWAKAVGLGLILGCASGLEAAAPPPKLVVGIVVDQMRADYLERFRDSFGEGGFRRLEREGFAYRSMHFNYVPTATGPGHAAVWSGAYPAHSGIANNDFFDRASGMMVYCVDDASVTPVGSNSEEGRKSPHQLLVTTVGDELKLATSGRSLVYGISLKDRSAVLPAGHFADGSYWFDYDSGRFITSSFYEDALPSWVDAYNLQGQAEQFLQEVWNPRDALDSYALSRPDANPFESRFAGREDTAFPHDIAAIGAAEEAEGEERYHVLANTPWGNTLVRELAEAALKETELGRDAVPDILAISFSATDYIGHQFGPASLEIEDTYRRLDDELAALLQTIDDTVGLENTLVFLTADHAVTYNSGYLRSLGLSSARTIDGRAFRATLEAALEAAYGPGPWIQEIFKGQIVLDRERIRAAGLDLAVVQTLVRDVAIEQNGIATAYTATDLQRPGAMEGLPGLLRRGLHPLRSGDVLCALTSGSLVGRSTGTNHSEAYSYDTHVPLLLRGPGIPVGGESFGRVEITQIAPTLAAWLRITPPSAAFEGVLPGLLP